MQYSETNNTKIICEGVRTHNLKNISVHLPKGKWIAITGVSGSGKSSFVFDTLAAESKKRFLETLGTYERQFLNTLPSGEFDAITNLPATICLKQENNTNSPRSTIATTIDISTQIQQLFFAFMDKCCALCGSKVIVNTEEEFINAANSYISKKNYLEILFATKISHNPGDTNLFFKTLLSQGFTKIICNNNTVTEIEDLINGDKTNNNNSTFLLVIDRFNPNDTNLNSHIRIQSIWKQIFYSTESNNISIFASSEETKLIDTFLTKPYCTNCLTHTSLINANNLNWNNALGACNTCEGIGTIPSQVICPSCLGKKLCTVGQNATAHGYKFYDLMNAEIIEAYKWIQVTKDKYKQQSNFKEIVEISSEIETKLQILISLGLDSLSLWRSCKTLSGGEYQRVLFARVLGTGLTDSLYILDEPSIGLGKTELPMLINAIKSLRDLDNTILMVEHSPDLIKEADLWIELGPTGGSQGGYIIETNQQKLPKSAQTTNLIKNTMLPKTQSMPITLNNFSAINCKNISISIPTCRLTVITGPSGAGKSTLLNLGLSESLEKAKQGLINNIIVPKNFFDTTDIVSMNQKSITRNQTSVVCTMLDIMNDLRQLFLLTDSAKRKGLTTGDFSFNSTGACKSCKGRGIIKDNLFFIGEFESICPDCNGLRFNTPLLIHKVSGKSIAEWLELSIEEAIPLFKKEGCNLPILETVQKLGIGYLNLGLSSRSLSGGEAQRLKIASSIHNGNKKQLCLFDEPSRGLSEVDIENLLSVFLQLTNKGNTFVVVEHHPLFIQYADKVINMGPKGGKNGGCIISEINKN